MAVGTRNAAFWDQWWWERLARSAIDLFPDQETWFDRNWGYLPNLGVSDHWLVHVMAEHGLRTVLCAGNGVAQEPRALAAAGFAVTALDISPLAVGVAQAYQPRAREFAALVAPPLHRPGGRVEFVAGDLRDRTACPGPFDVIIERRSVQHFDESDRRDALEALAGRLCDPGILLSECFDDPFPSELGWSQHPSGYFHASEAWCRAKGLTIWDGVPDATLLGQVALLVRTGSMKRPPDQRVGQGR
jgi:hypothetical protein